MPILLQFSEFKTKRGVMLDIWLGWSAQAQADYLIGGAARGRNRYRISTHGPEHRKVAPRLILGFFDGDKIVLDGPLFVVKERHLDLFVE